MMDRDGIRILIADDRPVFRYGLRALLEAEPDPELAGEADSGEEAIARRLIQYFAAPPAGATGAAAAPQALPELTEREREVLALLAQGYTNAVIAGRLVLSPETVRNHVSGIASKLQVADRAQAIIRARDAGLGGERG